MNRKLKQRILFGAVVSAGLLSCLEGTGVGLAQDRGPADSEKPGIAWRSPARLRHIARREKGNLSIGAEGIEFRSDKEHTMTLPYVEVQSFLVSSHSLTIETYQSRKKHLPGVERYRFDLAETVPPEVAAKLAKEVKRPSQNSVPDQEAQGTAIPAHHRTVRGGTNGTLRFHDGGIDYVTAVAGDSRSWRWSDLQTLSSPDPYRLLVFGYRDTYTFDLKEMLPQPLYYRLVDALDRHNAAESARTIVSQALKSSEAREPGVQP